MVCIFNYAALCCAIPILKFVWSIILALPIICGNIF